tara:strand:+ start:1746 stop:1859 length:114 start_codon:yes stop_codon:yes gene_type:complete
MEKETQIIIILIVLVVLGVYMIINWKEDDFTDDHFGM